MFERWEIAGLITVGIFLLVFLAMIVLELVEAYRKRAEDEDEHNRGIW